MLKQNVLYSAYEIVAASSYNNLHSQVAVLELSGRLKELKKEYGSTGIGQHIYLCYDNYSAIDRELLALAAFGENASEPCYGGSDEGIYRRRLNEEHAREYSYGITGMGLQQLLELDGGIKFDNGDRSSRDFGTHQLDPERLEQLNRSNASFVRKVMGNIGELEDTKLRLR